MGNIDWLPIAEIPDDWKDGRPVLVWEQSHPYMPTHVPARVAGFSADTMYAGEPYGWHDYYEFGVRLTPTYCAELTSPSGRPRHPDPPDIARGKGHPRHRYKA